MELAVTLPFLFTVLLGAAEFGRLSYAAIAVNNAARAGVAYGAQNATTANDATGMQTAATNDGSNISGLQATASKSCVCSDTSHAITCADTSACDGPAHVVTSVQVNTSAAFDPGVHVPGLPTTYTLTGQAIMQVGQ